MSRVKGRKDLDENINDQALFSPNPNPNSSPNPNPNPDPNPDLLLLCVMGVFDFGV